MMPQLLKRFFLRARATLSAQQDRDTRAELDLHLRLLEEEYLAKGVAPSDAHRLARREFGNPAVFQDASRDLFSFRLIEDLIRDLRHAGREMRRSAGFTAIAVASLAVGIGAATATFAVTEAVMLRPLTVRSPAGLLAFTTAADGGWATWSYAALARWQRLPASGGLYEVAGASDVRPFRSARGSGEPPEEVRVSLVSHNYFHASGARVVLGRPFNGRDAAGPGTGAVAIVSDGFWRRRFGGAPDVLARTIELGGVRFAVLGVAESGFTGLSVGHPADVWVPLTMQPALAPEMPGPSGLDESSGAETRWLKVVGRLADGASVDRAEGAARLVRQVFLAEKAARLGADKPEVARDRTESFRLVAGATGDGVMRAQFAPALATFAHAPGAVPQLRRFFRSSPEFEPLVLDALANDAGNADLILTLASPAGGSPQPWQAKIVGALVDKRQYAKAIAVWRRVAGVSGGGSGLLNPGFEDIGAPPPFNWSFATRGGVAEPAGNGRLDIIYYGREDAVLAQQMLLLSPGQYRLGLEVSGQAGDGSGVAWSVSCLPENKVIFSLPLKRGQRGAAGVFAVPQGCPAQRLELLGTIGEFPQSIDFSIGGLRLQRVAGR